jgi:hypothetical protein
VEPHTFWWAGSLARPALPRFSVYAPSTLSPPFVYLYTRHGTAQSLCSLSGAHDTTATQRSAHQQQRQHK